MRRAQSMCWQGSPPAIGSSSSTARWNARAGDGFALNHMNTLSRRLGARNYSTAFIGGLLMQATLDCPLDLLKTRSVWRQWDGGKWVCGLSYIGRTRPCVLYSIGSNFDASFEADVQKHVRRHRGAGCDVHIYDPTLPYKSKHGQGDAKVEAFRRNLQRDRVGALHLIGLSADANSTELTMRTRRREVRMPMQTLEQMLRANGHTCVDILKIDVDGAESGTLLKTDWSALCVGLILLEHHGRLIQKVRHEPYRVSHALHDVRRLERAGFRLYSSEVVCAYCEGQTELAFINVSWAREMLALEPAISAP